MKLLLDTHAFMWWNSTPTRISATALRHLEEPENEVFISLASLWEIQIKTQLGKLTLKTELTALVRQQQVENGISLLSISLPHILEIDKLPYHHKDPFDRLIIAQSRVELASIVTCDNAFKRYDCKTVW